MNDNAQKTLARIKDVETNKADNSTVTDISNEVTTLKGSVQTNTNKVSDLEQQIATLTASLQQLQRQVDDTRTFKFEGNYDNQATYQKSSAVVSNNQLYISLIDNNRNPLTDTLSWLRLENFAPTADLNNFYTKVQIDTKLNDYLTRTTFNNEKNTFALKGSTNTFTANQVFNNQVKMGTFRWSPETNAIRFSPESDSKWLYFGNPSDNKYFGGIDLNDRVKLKGLPNPVSDGDAVNKRYLEEQLTLRIAPRLPMYLAGQSVLFANKVKFTEALARLETKNGGRPTYYIQGDTNKKTILCLGGLNYSSSSGNMTTNDNYWGSDSKDVWRLEQSNLPKVSYGWQMRYTDANTAPMNRAHFNAWVIEGNTNTISQVSQQWDGVKDWGHNGLADDHIMRFINYRFYLNPSSQTDLDFRRYEGYVLVTFTTDVYLKQTTTIEAQQLQEQNTIVETPNETTIFVGEA